MDDALADQLLRALGQLEDLHARGDAVLGPAERLRGAVLGQAAVEHRADRLGLLVGVQLLARDVLHRAVGVLGLASRTTTGTSASPSERAAAMR